MSSIRTWLKNGLKRSTPEPVGKKQFVKGVEDKLVNDTMKAVREYLTDSAMAAQFVHKVTRDKIVFRICTYTTNLFTINSPAGVRVVEQIKAMGFHDIEFIDLNGGPIDVTYYLDRK